ncbi:hypothetical protein OIU84_022616 [Salix udensis]|uniref:Uncharacterized protein n=1 Tax=Salix udensis TaxID=889485 RepID=A0AAD6KNZ0_9ROSI|nr:hypothetical protein OIU84_022616 [Salix udensis]
MNARLCYDDVFNTKARKALSVSLQPSPFAIRHSPFAIRHSQPTPHHPRRKAGLCGGPSLMVHAGGSLVGPRVCEKRGDEKDKRIIGKKLGQVMSYGRVE